MKRGLSRPVMVWMWQVGIGMKFDRIRTAWGDTYCASVFLPFVSVVLCYTP